jgi:hypothetical protein
MYSAQIFDAGLKHFFYRFLIGYISPARDGFPTYFPNDFDGFFRGGKVDIVDQRLRLRFYL